MYNKYSLKAEEFINHEEILNTLEYAEKNKNNKELINKILEKARPVYNGKSVSCAGLDHREASVLLACEDKELIKKMDGIIYKLEEPKLIQNAKQISITSNKIIEAIEKKPNKIKNVKNFLNYYLPVTLKILERYDEIENQKLNIFS